jgi:hypothetical protein
VAAPEKFVEHLRGSGYHPRSNVHGKFLCEHVLEDLLVICPRISEHAAAGRLVYDIQRKIIVAGSEWNIDLVLGPPPGGGAGAVPARGIIKASPATIRVAIEAKTVMTEHGKARRNRQRDLDSFHQFVHRYDINTIAAGLTVVNLADRFKSPLRQEVSLHRNIKTLVQETMSLLRALPQRSARGDEAGLEANGAILVNHDNVDFQASRLIIGAPAPQVGDPLNYDSFLRRICDSYTHRWSNGVRADTT